MGVLFGGWLKINWKGQQLQPKQGLVKMFFIKVNYFFQLFIVFAVFCRFQ